MVYLAVAQSGKVSAARVSALTKINRTTVYSVSKNLKKLGLITEDLGGAVGYFTALPVEGLGRFVENEKNKLEEKTKLVAQAITELQPLVARVNYSVPRMQFVEEENINDHLYRQSKIWIQSVSNTDNVWWGFQDHTFVETYSAWLDWFWKLNPTLEDLRLLTNQADTQIDLVKKLPKERKMKYWSGGQKEFDATTWIAGDHIIMVMTRERPHYLVEIHDAVLARNQRALFAGIWSELENKK